MRRNLMRLRAHSNLIAAGFAMILGGALGLAACSDGAGTGVVAEHEAAMTMVVFDVEGMTCESCEKAIKSAVEKMDGVQSVEASHVKGQATVAVSDANVDVEAIAETIRKMGYSVSLSSGADAGS